MKTVLALGLVLLLIACQTSAPLPAANNTSVPRTQMELAYGPYATTGALVTYSATTKGYLTEPQGTGVYPGVVLIHEWWGLNDQIKRTADVLASHGYRVLAVDLYAGAIAQNAEEALQLVQAVDAEQAATNLADAVAYVRRAGSPKVASWGYCFGGGQSMNLALTNAPIDATVVYYGNLDAALANPQAVHHPVLFIYGDQDQNTPARSALELQTKLDALGVQNEVHVYPGVGHAFANPSNPQHNVPYTQDAWEKTLSFLQKNLR